jgi:hypothetical protein
MKATIVLPTEGKQVKPLPNEKANQGSSEPRKRTLSKDDLIDALEQSSKACEECVDSTGRIVHETVPVLLLLEKALDQDEAMDDFVVHMKDGDLRWCHSGNAVATILGWLSTRLAEGWNKIDGSEFEAKGVIERYRADHPKAANSR